MRDRETIDSELRRIASIRRSSHERGARPSSREIDALLDERLGHHAEATETEVAQARATVVTDTRRDFVETGDTTPRRDRGAQRRLGRLSRLAALPLSLVAVATVFVLVVMFAVHHPHPAAEATDDPPSSARPQPTAPAPPIATTPPLAIVDRAFIGVLEQEGVPIPSHEYVMSHGHAVCDFLTQQPSFTDAVGFVQRSTIWDANQSDEFAAGAIVSYCPQYERPSPGQMQQPYQNALSDLQAIQGRLRGIEGDLQGIRDGLQPITGH
ncbi:MAG: hypothetical protein QOG19_1324 [Mycobacterium sp.]|nr:hypothetical protein [Mycobacterium sp.]